MTKLITCVVCPFGCQIQVENEKDGGTRAEGNRCKRGLEYALHEFAQPVRTLTSCVAVANGERPVFPVRTEKPIPKEKIKTCMELLSALKIEAPVRMHQVVAKDIAGTGVNLVAVACVERK